MKKIFTLIASLMMVLSMNAATKTIYCKMAQSWWKTDGAAVGAYYWEPQAAPSWPGVRMTPVTGETDLWSIDIDTDKYTKIIFTRVNGSGNVSYYGAKTADLTIPTDDKNLYTITSSSPVWGDPGCTGEWSTYTPNAPKTYKDITFTITANAAPQIHYWEGGDKMVGSDWENLPTMTATGNANEYTYTVKDVDEATGVKYLLKIGNIQTSDKITSENVIADFKDLMPEVYVKGVTGWTGDGHKMTIADDYSASVTITLAANLTADLKLTIGGNWMGDAKNAITKENNSSVFDTNGANGSIKTDIAGDYVFTYTYADQTLTVTYPTEEIEVAVDCYVTGNTALTGEDWVLNSENLKMTKVEGTEKYTYTFTALPANTAFELKVVYAGSQKGFSSLSEAIDGVTANGDNICFTLEETGDVTVTYDAETEKIALTGNFAIPVTYDYYIAGTLAGGWNATQQGMENVDGLYKAIFSALPAGTYEFKITDGQFNSADDNTHEHTTLGAAYEEVSYNEGNIKIDTDEAINLTVIFDAATDKITFEGLTETTPAKCYLMGIGGDWTTGIEMEEDGDQFKLLCQPIAEDDQFKFKHGDIWSDGVENYDFPGINWVDDDNDGDYHITLPAGNYNFYYKKATNQVWIEAATDCVTEPTTVTLTYDLTTDAINERMGRRYVTAEDATLGEVQIILPYFSTETTEYAEAFLIVGSETLNATATYAADAANNLEVYTATATSEDGATIYNVTMNVTVPATQEYTFFAMNDAEYVTEDYGEEGEPFIVYLISGEGYLNDETVAFEMSVDQTNYLEGSINDVYVMGNATTILEEEGSLYVTGIAEDEGGNTYNIEMYVALAAAEVEIVITDEVNVTLGYLNLEVMGNMAMVTAGNEELPLSFWLTLLETENYYGSYGADMFSNIWYGDNQLQPYGDGTYNQNGLVVSFISEPDEAGNATKYNFTLKKDEIYSRAVTNQWGTICLPKASSNFTGATFYEVSSLDPTEGLWLDQLAAGAQLAAGKPYIFQATASVIAVTYTGEAATTPQAGTNGLTGTFTDIAAAAGSVLVGNYIIAQNAVHVATASNDLPANRAYINAASVPTTTQAEIPGRRRVCMGENAATGLDQIVAPEGQAVKAIVNGQLIIIRDGVKYNVQGQKL